MKFPRYPIVAFIIALFSSVTFLYIIVSVSKLFLYGDDVGWIPLNQIWLLFLDPFNIIIYALLVLVLTQIIWVVIK